MAVGFFAEDFAHHGGQFGVLLEGDAQTVEMVAEGTLFLEAQGFEVGDAEMLGGDTGEAAAYEVGMAAYQIVEAVQPPLERLRPAAAYRGVPLPVGAAAGSSTW